MYSNSLFRNLLLKSKFCLTFNNLNRILSSIELISTENKSSFDSINRNQLRNSHSFSSRNLLNRNKCNSYSIISIKRN